MDWLPGILSLFPDLTPAEAGAVALVVFLGLIVLDIYASDDEEPGNTPREVVVRWAHGNVTVLGLRLSGAALAFLLGALIGHWFHPGIRPLVSGGFVRLGIVLGAALVLAVATGLRSERVTARLLCACSLIGVLVAMFAWPVGV